MYYKGEQIFCTTKCGKWYYKVGKVLQSVAISAKKGGRYYKAGKLLLQSGEIITK